MPTKVTQKHTAGTVAVKPISVARLVCHVVGVAGLYHHRMSLKATNTLLVGGRKKTATEKREVKHHPRDEFRDSMHLGGRSPGPLVQFPGSGFKRALRTAAIESEGITGAAVDRLIWVEDEMVGIHGIPFLRMDVVRSADMNKTPDVRTRAFMPEWAASFTISYCRLSIGDVNTLLQNAGHIVGIGDFRQEKGRGSYGRFMVAGKDAFDARMTTHEEQVAAVEAADPDAGHGDTMELLRHYDATMEAHEVSAG